MAKPTLSRVNELLRYDPDTGEFRWLLDRNQNVKSGDLAGSIQTNGYRYIGIDGKLYKASRLAWLVNVGAWPSSKIDHEDRVRSNDRILNLRQATNLQNAHNRNKNSNNTTGYKGVHYCKRSDKFVARIRCNWKRFYLGSFETEAQANQAYVAASKLHGVFASPTNP